jgi:KTSC domain
LQLEFRGRAVYHYCDIPATVHRGLLSAESKGSFFHRSIRGRFPYCVVSCRCGAPDSDAGRRGLE